MILYFLRHGDAGSASAGDDDARELTEAGERQLRAAVATWQRLNLRPDAVVTSPLLRAQQTAAIFCEGMGLPPPVGDDRLRPGARWGDFAKVIAARPDAGRVMFVGHEPDLSNAVARLSGASAVRLRKAGVACLEFPGVPEPGAGEIAWLIDPDLYGDA